MKKIISKKRLSRKDAGSPVTSSPVGDKSHNVKLTIMDYNETQFQEKEVKTIEECFPFKNESTVTWINLDGLKQAENLEKLGNCFGFHPLVLEDILNTEQRPKTEDFDTYIYTVVKMINYNESSGELEFEQLSLILGSNFVISFQEKEGDIFNPIRERIRNGKGRIRKMGADYLVYALIDAVVDSYFLIPEKLGEKIEYLQEELVADPTTKTLDEIQNLKREMIFLRKAVWPLREVVNGLERAEQTLMKKTTSIYLRNVYEHTIQVIDTVETMRDMISGMIDMYLSSVSNKLNEIMKVLTVISTIFIPLTFLTGLYGMNFKHMPELEWHNGYYVVLIVMVVLSGSMLTFFKQKKWF